MLTLRDAIDRDESTEVEEIDLDKNVTTMSYAKNMKRGVPVSDSLVMLPQRDSHLTQADVLEPLKQGRFHSWDRYFTEGQALVKRHPRKLEFSIVKSFIAGLYATKQREQCVQWLELNGWTWESVAGFGLSGTPCVPVYQDSVDPGALVGPNEAAEKVVKSPITQDSTPTIARQSKKKVKGGSTGKPNPKTRSSQRLRNQSQVTKSVHQPRNTKQDKTPVATLPRSRSQRAPTKTATPRRDASGRFLRQRSSSPAIAARSSQASARGSIANGKKGLSRKAAKMGEHASSLKQAKVRAAEQEAIAVPTVLNAGIDVEPVQAAPQRPTTPPRQPSPSQGPEQTVPRLIRRRKSVDRVSEVQARKRRRLMDEQGLPPLSPQSVQPDGKESGRKRKRRRLPLPPPPEIPIMPTSDE